MQRQIKQTLAFHPDISIVNDWKHVFRFYLGLWLILQTGLEPIQHCMWMDFSIVEFKRRAP